MVGACAEAAREHGAAVLTPSGVHHDIRRRHVAQSGLVGELWAFMRERKKWWLLPILIVLLTLGALLVFAQGSALAPFIYTIF